MKIFQLEISSFNLKISPGDMITSKIYTAAVVYAPLLKAAEARLLLALAAANGDKVIKTDTKQAYLYGNMGDDVVYTRPPDWWPEPVPEGHLLKAFMEPGRQSKSGVNIYRAGLKEMDVLL